MTYRLPADIQKRMDDVNAKLKARQRELDAEEKKGTAEEAARHAAGAAYMADYRRRLADTKTAEQAQRDAAREQELAPVKRREMLQWLVDHPDQGESDFERIWPAKRELLKIGDRDELVQREIAAQRRRY
jgi:hypothetical protein